MTRFLAGVLSVIAVGVLLIAYGLLNPRVATFDGGSGLNGVARPMFASEQMLLRRDPSAVATGYVDRTGAPVYAVPTSSGYAPDAAPQVVYNDPPVRDYEPAPRRRVTRTVERRAGRNWKKTALVIGGSSAAGAGVGAIFGGRKGALIGAAIGGGASTIYETTKQ